MPIHAVMRLCHGVHTPNSGSARMRCIDEGHSQSSAVGPRVPGLSQVTALSSATL
jgi:hypothetical protein